MTSHSAAPPGGRLALLLGLTSFGEEAFSVSLPLALLSLGLSTSAPVLVHGALYVSLVLSGLAVGSWIDRYETYRTLRYAFLAAASTVAAAALALAVIGHPILIAIAAVLVLGVVGATVAASIDAGAGRTDPARVSRLYGAMESVRTAAMIVGPALGGVIAAAGLRVVLAGYSALFVAGALLTRGSLPAPERPDAETSGGRATVLAEFRSNPPLLGGIALSSSLNIGLGAMIPLALSRLRVEFHLDGQAIGVALATVGIASVVAAQISGRAPSRRLAVPAVLTAGCVILVGQASSPVLLVGATAAASALAVFFNVRWRMYRQAVTTPWRLGAVSSWCRSMAYTWIAVISFVAASLIGGSLTIRDVQTGAGVVSLCAVLACMASGLLGRDRVEAAMSERTDPVRADGGGTQAG